MPPRDAESEAQRIVSEARSAAREIIESAETGRREAEDEARLRQERIAMETGALEARRSKALRHLQEIAAAIANLEAATPVEGLRASTEAD